MYHQCQSRFAGTQGSGSKSAGEQTGSYIPNQHTHAKDRSTVSAMCSSVGQQTNLPRCSPQGSEQETRLA